MTPFGLPPVGARLLGLSILVSESVLRLRSLEAVIEDLRDGVFVPTENVGDVLHLIATSLGSEVGALEQLSNRLSTLTNELRRSELRR